MREHSRTSFRRHTAWSISLILFAGLSSSIAVAAPEEGAAARRRVTPPAASSTQRPDEHEHPEANAEFRVDAEPASAPPGTCSVTEALVAEFCGKHPDDASCRSFARE